MGNFCLARIWLSLDIEAERSQCPGGVKDSESGRRQVWLCALVDPSFGGKAPAALSVARKSPSIEGFELPGNQSASSVSGMKDKAILDMARRITRTR